MTNREAALAALQERLAHAAAENDSAELLTADAYRDAQALMTVGNPEDLAVAIHWEIYRAVRQDLGKLRGTVASAKISSAAVPKNIKRHGTISVSRLA